MNVTDIIITTDGSWRAIMESDKETDQAENNSMDVSSQKEGSEQQESTLLDLTKDNDDDMMDAAGTCNVEDTKPLRTDVQNNFVSNNTIIPPQQNSMMGIHHSNGGHLQSNLWPGISFPGSSNFQTVSISESFVTNPMTVPRLVHNCDAMSQGSTSRTSSLVQNQLLTAHNLPLQGLNAMISNTTTSSLMQNQVSSANNSQLQQLQSSDAVINNEYGRVSSMSRHINRIPIGILALPAQFQTPGSEQPSRMNILPNGPPFVSQAAPSAASSGNGLTRLSNSLNRQQQFPGTLMNSCQASGISSSSSPYPTAQVWFLALLYCLLIFSSYCLLLSRSRVALGNGSDNLYGWIHVY